MSDIQNTKAAIGFYEKAIKNAQELIEIKINKDQDVEQFREKLKKISPDYGFLFYGHTLDFGMYSCSDAQVIRFFEIVEGGEIVYTENTFEGIEEVAAEAQKVVSKFL